MMRVILIGEGVKRIWPQCRENARCVEGSKGLYVVFELFLEPSVKIVNLIYPFFHALPVQLKSIAVMHDMAELSIGRQIGGQGLIK